ncbi:MAG: fibronectin type III domain-containing protein, partial [Pseudomonadota bacterium]
IHHLSYLTGGIAHIMGLMWTGSEETDPYAGHLPLPATERAQMAEADQFWATHWKRGGADRQEIITNALAAWDFGNRIIGYVEGTDTLNLALDQLGTVGGWNRVEVLVMNVRTGFTEDSQGVSNQVAQTLTVGAGSGDYLVILEKTDAAATIPDPGGVTVPSAFAGADFSLTPGDTEIDVVIASLPDDGGAAITSVEYQVDGGAWTASGGTVSFTITGLTNDTAYGVRLRAVNSQGAGPDGVQESATPTAAGGGGTGTVTRSWATQSYVARGEGARTEQTFNFPQAATAGQFIRVIRGCDSGFSTTITGYTEAYDSSDLPAPNAVRVQVSYLVAAGGETSVTIPSHNGSNNSDKAQPIIIEAFNNVDTASLAFLEQKNGSSASCAFPQFTTTAANTHVTVIGAMDDRENATATAAPTDYGDLLSQNTRNNPGLAETAPGSGTYIGEGFPGNSASLGVASKTAATATTETPADMVFDESEETMGVIMLMQPAT